MIKLTGWNIVYSAGYNGTDSDDFCQIWYRYHLSRQLYVVCIDDGQCYCRVSNTMSINEASREIEYLKHDIGF